MDIDYQKTIPKTEFPLHAELPLSPKDRRITDLEEEVARLKQELSARPPRGAPMGIRVTASKLPPPFKSILSKVPTSRADDLSKPQTS